MSEDVPAGPPAPGGLLLDWLGVALVCLCAALACVLEVLYVPLYAGSSLVPVTVLAAIATNVAFPLLARRLVPNLLGVGLPFAVWLLVLVVFGLLARPEGDVILPGGSLQNVSYGLMLGGALAGIITVVVAAPNGRRPVPPRDRGTAS